MQIIANDDSCKHLLSCSMSLLENFRNLIYEIVSSKIDELLNTLGLAVRTIGHWFMYHLLNRKERIICNNVHAIIASLKIQLCVTPLYRIFLEISTKLRNVHLHRPRPRGSDDDFDLVFLATN